MIVDFGTEYMGLFGFSWQEKVAGFMKKQLAGTAAAKKLSSFWQAGGVNVALVKNLHNEYMALMARGNPPSSFAVAPGSDGRGGQYSPSTLSLAATLSGKTNIETSIVLEFLRALYVLARDGKIPFEKWNPSGYAESTALRKTFISEKGLLDVFGKTANTGKIVLIVAGVGVGAYFLSQLKTLKGG